MAASLYRVPNSLVLLGGLATTAGVAGERLQRPDGSFWILVALVGISVVAVGMLTGLFISIGSMFAQSRRMLVVEVVTRSRAPRAEES